MKKQIKVIKTEWVKLSNKEMTKEWGIKDDISEGTDAGYKTNETYKVIRGESYMIKKEYNKSYGKKNG
jgi:hypothetical protein